MSEREGRIWCSECGKSASSPVPKDTVVRAWVECPECIEKKADAESHQRRKLACKFADHVMAEGVRFPAWIEKCGADAVRVALQEWFEEQLDK